MSRFLEPIYLDKDPSAGGQHSVQTQVGVENLEEHNHALNITNKLVLVTQTEHYTFQLTVIVLLTTFFLLILVIRMQLQERRRSPNVGV